MRYFKYSGPWPELEALRKQYAHAAGKRRRRSLWNKLGTVVFWVVWLGSLVGLMFLVFLLTPEKENLFEDILRVLCRGSLGFVAIIVSAILGFLAANPFWTIDKKTEKTQKRAALQKACDHLRPFYEFREPCLVTKCYRCSDRKWDRHDVCLFIVGEELRITANLQYGFFRPEKDLGCYALTPQEITIRDSQFRQIPAMELEADGVTFLLSRTARTFIERRFLDNRS